MDYIWFRSIIGDSKTDQFLFYFFFENRKKNYDGDDDYGGLLRQSLASSPDIGRFTWGVTVLGPIDFKCSSKVYDPEISGSMETNTEIKKKNKKNDKYIFKIEFFFHLWFF